MSDDVLGGALVCLWIGCTCKSGEDHTLTLLMWINLDLVQSQTIEAPHATWIAISIHFPNNESYNDPDTFQVRLIFRLDMFAYAMRIQF